MNVNNTNGNTTLAIGCGSVQSHAQKLLQVFTFKQTPVVHPPSAKHQPFFGHGGTLSETPTGDVFEVRLVDVGIESMACTLPHVVPAAFVEEMPGRVDHEPQEPDDGIGEPVFGPIGVEEIFVTHDETGPQQGAERLRKAVSRLR